LSGSFHRTKDLIARQEYASDRTGSQLYVSRFGDPVLDIATGSRAVGYSMSTRSRVIWLCCSKPVLLIPLFRALTESGITEYALVASLMREFDNANKGTVALSHILTHTVPYESVGMTWTGDSVHTRSERTVMTSPWDAAIKAICEMSLTANPGELVTYVPATNWMLLAEILERLTGCAHEVSVAEQVLRPLGMDNTSVYVTEQDMQNLELAPLWDLENNGGKPRLEEIETEPFIFSRWPGLACRGPARDMAKPIECAAGWLSPESLDDAWRLKLLSPCRRDLSDPTLYGAELLWSLGLCVDPVRFGLPLSARVVGHTGERSSAVFADLDTGVTISFLSSGLVSDAVDQRRKRAVVRAVYHDLNLSL
jgi:CubicO group peptidase (beta-lactamase class C family)